MHELLHYASGARAPIVMANVNRTVASPWAFWPDQTDSLSQRDTGWIQYYVESAQEALDTVIQAYRVAEQVLVPAMVNLDAFYVSHAMEPVLIPSQELVDGYLPAFDPPHKLDTDHVESWGNVVSQEMFFRHRQDLGEAMARVPSLAAQADHEWAQRTSRSYGVIERYRCDGARTVIVTMGSMCGTARDAVDLLREAGQAVGLVKVRLFRPLPMAACRGAGGRGRRHCAGPQLFPGHGGVLHQELRAALYGGAVTPRIHGLLAGVGGVNVSPLKIVEFVNQTRHAEPLAESQWVR
ncbi:MAG: pyruvate ferredoxin oxidoreductase [Rhodoferax sp.]|nr:pyruvate ferredoxin oxidoreductase [Rhodoferax sp.]